MANRFTLWDSATNRCYRGPTNPS